MTRIIARAISIFKIIKSYIYKILIKDSKWDSKVFFYYKYFYNFDNLFVMDVWFPYIFLFYLYVEKTFC